MKHYIIPTVFTLALFCEALHAASSHTPPMSSVNVGRVAVKVPPPSGEFVEVGYDNREILEFMVPAQNRLLAAFVTPNDLHRLTRRDENLQMSRYMMIQVPRGAENMDCSPADFAEIVSAAKEQFDSTLNSLVKESQEEINRRLKSIEVSHISLGKPVFLGSLFSNRDAYSFGMIVPMTQGHLTTNMGMGGIILRVKSKILFVYVYSEYKDQETIKWLGKTTESWAKQIVAANEM